MNADMERGHRTWISQKMQKRKVSEELVPLQRPPLLHKALTDTI